jgi:beta-lactam-binding protein with PASTA domain
MIQARSVSATFTLNPAPPACVVPKLKGKTLKAAKRMLTKAHCKPGRITKKFSRVKKGRVISQKPKPGKHLAAGAKVNLVVSKGKKH